MEVAPSAPAIETRGLRKLYGKIVALESLDLEVAPGEVFGFLGPNGAGKTTAIKLLLGLVYPTAGEARVLGSPISDRQVRARIGYLPEQFQFHEWMTAREFLEFHGRLYGIERSRLQERIPRALRRVGLEDRAGDPLRVFSKGMLQRVGIAQALLNEPSLVFLDEPTSGLDPLGRRDMRDLVRDLKAEGVTVFLNSHILSDMEAVCDRVAILDHGRIVRSGPLDALLVDRLSVELELAEAAPAVLDALSAAGWKPDLLDGTVTIALQDQAEIPSVVETVVGAGGKLYRVMPRRTSLEDFFIEVVREKDGA